MECKQRDGNSKEEFKRNDRKKITLTEMENASDGLISSLDTAKNLSLRMLIKTSKTENQREKKTSKQTN